MECVLMPSLKPRVNNYMRLQSQHRAVSWSVSCHLVIILCTHHCSCFSKWRIKQEIIRFRNLACYDGIKTGISLSQLPSSVGWGGQASLSYFCCKNHHDIQTLGWAVWTAASSVHSSLQTVDQMDSVSVKETFGRLWQWKLVVIQAKPYEDKCLSLTHLMCSRDLFLVCTQSLTESLMPGCCSHRLQTNNIKGWCCAIK